jgi:hypothetical protein
VDIKKRHMTGTEFKPDAKLQCRHAGGNDENYQGFDIKN